MRRGPFVLVAVALVALLWPAPGSARAGDGASVDRVLLLALPTVEWADLHSGSTPNIDGLVDGSAVASLSLRGVGARTSAADAYATIGAGTRAQGVSGSGQVLEVDEELGGQAAGVLFRRRTGTVPPEGLVHLAFGALDQRNVSLDFDAEVGSLGEALAGAGIDRAVLANADVYDVRGVSTLDRSAATALVDRSGTVSAGAVSRSLTTESPAAPFGLALDRDAVLSAFDVLWPRTQVVLVEGSDLARADRYAGLASPAQRTGLREEALRSTDELVGALLQRVDPQRDAVLAIGPYHRSGDVHLTVAALRAPGAEPGLLRSASTRRSGFVTLADVAPTVLQLLDVKRPGAMEGRPFEAAAMGDSRGAERSAELAETNRAALFRDRMVTPVALTFVILQAVLWVGAALALNRGGAPARLGVRLAALALLLYLPATYLARLVSFHAGSATAYWAFVAGVATVGAIGALLAGRRSSLDPLLLALGAIFGLLVVDIVLGAPLQLNSVFGYSPTVGGRFAGMGNLAYGQFVGAAFLLCGLLALRLSGRSYAAATGLAVLVLAVVVDGLPPWGSDVGGVLALVPAAGVTATMLLGQSVRWRGVILWGFGALGAVVAFAAVDLAQPVGERTHLGRLVESVGERGWGSLLTVITRKLEANLSVITSSVWTAMVPVALGFFAYLLWRAPGRVRAIRESIPAALAGLAVVGFLGFALNDSGIAVPGIMLGVVNASLVFLTVRMPAVTVKGEPPHLPGSVA